MLYKQISSLILLSAQGMAKMSVPCLDLVLKLFSFFRGEEKSEIESACLGLSELTQLAGIGQKELCDSVERFKRSVQLIPAQL